MFGEFDLIVFGASGYTGQYVVEEVVRSAGREKIKWAISGRNIEKLKKVLITATEVTGIDVTNIPVFDADINSEDSLRAMTGRTKVVLNCVGPYTLYGEAVIRACIDTATHYLDLSGEVAFNETIHVKYDSLAKKKAIYIINFCGLSNDLWLPHIRRLFDSHISSVETLMTSGNDKDILDNVYNIGTFMSLIQTMITDGNLKDIRSRLYSQVFQKELPETKFKLKSRWIPFTNEYTKGLYIPIEGILGSMALRTNHLRWETRNERPIQVRTYVDIGSYWKLMVTAPIFMILFVLSRFQWGRDLLERYPSLFTFGRFTKDGPTRQCVKNSSFVHTYIVKGWKNKMRRHPDDEPGGLDPPYDMMVARLTGPEPSYPGTSACLVQSGITLIKDSHKMGSKGGVVTPGSVFGGTELYDRLRRSGLIMEVVKLP